MVEHLGMRGHGNTVNITKAKDITKDRLREKRKPLLEAQDLLFMKAQETGAEHSYRSRETKTS